MMRRTILLLLLAVLLLPAVPANADPPEPFGVVSYTSFLDPDTAVGTFDSELEACTTGDVVDEFTIVAVDAMGAPRIVRATETYACDEGGTFTLGYVGRQIADLGGGYYEFAARVVVLDATGDLAGLHAHGYGVTYANLGATPPVPNLENVSAFNIPYYV